MPLAQQQKQINQQSVRKRLIVSKMEKEITIWLVYLLTLICSLPGMSIMEKGAVTYSFLCLWYTQYTEWHIGST